VISFRYHIISLVGVFLALALGIVIGTTALSGPVTSDLRHQVDDLKTDRSQLAIQNKNLQGQVDVASQFTANFGPQIVAGSLDKTNVLIVALPGASSGMVDGIGNGLSQAGATITGRLELAGSYVDPSLATSIQDLAVGPSHPIGLVLPQTDDPRVLGAALLAYALVGKGEQTDLNTVLSGFSGLHMIDSDPSGIDPAKDVVILGNGSLAKNSYASEAESDIVAQFAAAGATVVVGGDSGSAQGAGVVASVRSGDLKTTVSTVDNADSPFGQVTTALALAGAIDQQVGQYGTGPGAEALFPTRSK
jgi:Copper transport outer membrane protein, MctB